MGRADPQLPVEGAGGCVHGKEPGIPGRAQTSGAPPTGGAATHYLARGLSAAVT